MQMDKKLIVDNCKVMYIKIKKIAPLKSKAGPKNPNETPAKSATARKEDC